MPHRLKSPQVCNRCNSTWIFQEDTEPDDSCGIPDLSQPFTNLRIIRHLVCMNCGFKMQWPDVVTVERFVLDVDEEEDA